MSKVFVILVSLLAVAGGFGCAALSEYVTPAVIDRNAVDYAVIAGVAGPNDFDGYGNLYKANKLAGAVDAAHEQNQLALAQHIDRDALNYAQLVEAVRTNVATAIQQEELLFSEKGIIAMGLGLAGFGTLTGLLGLARKRAGDLTPLEVKQALAGPEAKLTEREGQFAELVKGIQKYIEDAPGDFAIEDLKNKLGSAQSSSTKVLVAKIKSTL